MNKSKCELSFTLYKLGTQNSECSSIVAVIFYVVSVAPFGCE